MNDQKKIVLKYQKSSRSEGNYIAGRTAAGWQTTLMEMLKENLEQQFARTLYLNLDIEWDEYYFFQG